MRRFAYVAIWLLVFTIPWENTLVLESVGTVAKASGWVVGGVGVAITLIENRVRLPLCLHIGAVFVAWSWLSGIWSIDRDSTVTRAFTYTQLWVMAWLIYQYTDRLDGLLSAYVWGAGVAVGLTIYAFAQGIQAAYLRFAAQGFDPNDLSVYLALAIVFSAFLATKSPHPLSKAIYLAYIPLVALAVLLTGSRTGAVAFVIALIAMVLGIRRMDWRWQVTALSLSVAGGIIVASFVPWESISRVATLLTELREGTWNMRLLIWKAGLTVFGEHLVLGVGAGAFRAAVNPLVLQEAAPHNVFLAVAVEGGIPALLVWNAFIFTSFAEVLCQKHPERWLWIGVVLVLASAFIALNFEWRKTTWVMMALAAIAKRRITLTKGEEQARP